MQKHNLNQFVTQTRTFYYCISVKESGIEYKKVITKMCMHKTKNTRSVFTKGLVSFLIHLQYVNTDFNKSLLIISLALKKR